MPPRRGPLFVTPDERRRLIAALLRAERPFTGLVNDGPDAVTILQPQIEIPAAPIFVRTFLAKFTASVLLGGQDAQWFYTGEEVEQTGNGLSVDTVEDGFADDAVNIAEFGHIAEPISSTAWYVWGVDLHGTDIESTGIGARPVGGGGTDDTHKTDFLAIVTEEIIGNSAVFWFDKFWTPDGDCT